MVTICTAQWSLYVPPNSTYKIPMLCPHNVFLCFVSISEQTAIISPYSINWVVFTRTSQMKALNMFYLVIYWTQKINNYFIFLCSIVLPSAGHSSNHEYHCWNLQDNRAVFRGFTALLRFSCDSPSYNQDGRCLLRGTSGVFKYNSGHSYSLSG